jgi:hypothetical protein
MKTDQQFAEDIERGNTWELRLYEELSKYLYGLTEPEVAETFEGRVIGGFSYVPDIQVEQLVVAKGGLDERFYGTQTASIECKLRLGQFRFTSADDYPYPTVIVNEVYKTGPRNLTPSEYLALSQDDQKARMRPFHSYWIASSDGNHVAVICPATKPLWIQKATYSPKDRRPALNWECPLRKPNGGPAVLFGRFPEDVRHLLTYL